MNTRVINIKEHALESIKVEIKSNSTITYDGATFNSKKNTVPVFYATGKQKSSFDFVIIKE